MLPTQFVLLTFRLTTIPMKLLNNEPNVLAEARLVMLLIEMTVLFFQLVLRFHKSLHGYALRVATCGIDCV